MPSHVSQVPAADSASAVPHFDSASRIAKLIAARMASYRAGTLFVVYCAGPHCNGAERGALRLARLGLPVKVMIGGMTGWADEGFGVEHGAPDTGA